MKRRISKYLAIMLVIALTVSMFTACGGENEDSNSGGSGDAKTLTFAYQYGLQYLPAKIVKEQKLIEKNYDGDVSVEWQTLNSGAAVNEAMVAGSIDGGMLGAPVAVTGVNQGVPYKIFTGLSNIGNKFITSDSSKKTLKDFVGSDDKIALVNTGSVQHITLAYAAKELFGDAHALDEQITGMAHPDGMQALIAGSVQAHFTTIPYWNKELNEKANHEITEVAENAMPGASIIVAVYSSELQEKDPELYDAVVKAFNEAFEYIANEDNHEKIAEDMYEDEGVTKEEMVEYLKSDDVVFESSVTGIMEFAKFMTDEKFLENEGSDKESDYVFDGVEVKSIK